MVITPPSGPQALDLPLSLKIRTVTATNTGKHRQHEDHLDLVSEELSQRGHPRSLDLLTIQNIGQKDLWTDCTTLHHTPPLTGITGRGKRGGGERPDLYTHKRGTAPFHAIELPLAEWVGGGGGGGRGEGGSRVRS